MAARRAFAIALKRQGVAATGNLHSRSQTFKGKMVEERRILGGRAGHSQVEESPSSRWQLELGRETDAQGRGRNSLFEQKPANTARWLTMSSCLSIRRSIDRSAQKSEREQG